MHRPHARPFLTGAISSIVLLAVMAGIMIGGIPSGPRIHFPWDHTMTLHVQLADADALAAHASVEIAGVKIGEVESVQAVGNHAVATLTIGAQYGDIHRDAIVYLRPHGLFGPKYISIVAGTTGSPVLADGATIPLAQTVQPVDLNAILQDLQSPEQQDLRTLFVQLGEAAASQGTDVNHMLAAADSLSRVLDSPLRAIDSVAPQLSSMLVSDEAFNNYFAQAPLAQLVANSEQTWQAFAANSGHVESILRNANAALGQLSSALNGESGNLASAIQLLGQPGGTIDSLSKFTYLLGLFGANLTGTESRLGTDPAALDVTGGVIAALTNISSAFRYSDPCPKSTAPPGSVNDNHCSVSPDHRQHYLDAHLGNFPPVLGPNLSLITGFESLLAS